MSAGKYTKRILCHYFSLCSDGSLDWESRSEIEAAVDHLIDDVRSETEKHVLAPLEDRIEKLEKSGQQHMIDGAAVEEAETEQGWQVFYAEGDEPVAVRSETFGSVRQERDELREENERLRAELAEVQR